MRKIYAHIKGALYFHVAGYFRCFARIYLRRWHPSVIVVTGSSGKTTLLHLLAAAYGSRAVVSYNANSAFGIPFNLLGFERATYSKLEWLVYFALAPFRAYRKVATERIYIAEADAERPGEGEFLADLLRPDVAIWLSLEEAHGKNYDALVAGGVLDRLAAVKKAMAHEFGFFLERTKKLSIVSADNAFIAAEASRSPASISKVAATDILSYDLDSTDTRIETSKGSYAIPALIPREAAVSVVAAEQTLRAIPAENTTLSFSSFTLPPGRSSVFKGIRGITLIDSSYNATIGGMKAMLALMQAYPAAGPKWLVLGDMIEQGQSERAEHTELAAYIPAVRPDRVILVGPRLRADTHQRLLEEMPADKVLSFLMPGEAWAYLDEHVTGGETILFKGARYLEGIVERMLADKDDAAQLCRRGRMWDTKRAAWGI